MLNCPYCNADLGAASDRLRGGRCPKCGSILSWEEDQAAPAAKQPDEDSLPISQVIRTLVERGGAAPRVDATIGSPLSTPTAMPTSQTPTMAFAATFVPGTNKTPPSQASPEAEHLDRLWRGAATVASTPKTTLKATENAPDSTVTDLLIRPFRIGQPGDPAASGAEYELQEIIGEGGVGTVYAARQASVDRIVAVKMLRNEFAHKRDHRNKFLSEAVVTGELDHPNIVPIYDLGTSDVGNLFYAMKRVRGTPWSDVLRHQSLVDNLRILMSVADAIAFAHSRGVIHRDIKPENVMLGDFGEVVVMDWGIALSTGSFVKSDRVLQTSSMGGTPAYMAPEMATGPLEKIGAASDIYLLGAVLYEIITGRPPRLASDVMSCLYAAARNEIQPTEKTGELLDIALKAMATQPADRYATVQDFQAAIREYESHSESVALSTRADEELVEARRTKDYQDFAQALFAYQEARCLWLGNERAKTGEIDTKLAYAETALEKGDYDLGVSLLDERHPDQAALHKRLVGAQRERTARKARFQALRRTAMSLAALVFLMLTGGLLFIGRQYRLIDRQYQQIEQSNKELNKSINDLNVAKVKLEDEKRNVETANSELTKTQSRLLSSNVALVAAKQTAISEAQTARQEEQNAAGASYRAQIGVAAERIDNNAFRDAQRLLDDYRTSQWSFFRHWEWGHLQWLCDRQAGELQIGPRIESLAASSDGKLLAAGTATGQALVFAADWVSKSIRPVAELNVGGPVSAIALSPDGSRLAIAGAFEQGAIVLCKRDGNRLEREEKRLGGHAAGVLSLGFSPRGDSLVSTARDGAVQLWNLDTGERRMALFGHSGPVWSAAFSPDGMQLVTAGEDTTVRVWRIGENQPRIYRGHDGPVYAVAFAPQGNWIASGGRDRDIHIWKADRDLSVPYADIARELERQRRGVVPSTVRTTFHSPDYRLLGHAAEVRELAFSADGAVLLSGGNDNTLRRWEFARDTKDPHFVTVFRGHGGWIRGCVLAGDSRFAASGSLDGSLKLWDANEYEEVRVLRGHEDALYWAAFSKDGRRIVTAGRDRRALLWSRDNREPLLVFDEGERTADPSGDGLAARLKEGHEFLVTSAAFLPDERRIVTSAGDGTVRIWDRQTGGQIQRLAKTGTISTLAASRDGRWLITGSETTDAQLWRTDDLSAPAARLSGHASDISAAAFSPTAEAGQQRLVTGDVLGNVRIWRYDLASKNARAETVLAGHAQGYAIAGLAFTPDGRRVLSASQDHTVIMHDAATGERLPVVFRHSGSVRAMDVSVNGSQAVTLCSTGKDQFRISLWDVATGAERACEVTLAGQALTSVVFHPNQRSAILASSGSGKSRLLKWDFSATELVPLWLERDMRGSVWSAVFSPDGSRLLAVGGTQARLLTADKGELERTFSPHGPVAAASFSPLGRMVATCSSDGDVKLWSADSADAEYGRVLLRMVRPHNTANRSAAINFVAFGPRETTEEATLLTAGDDGTARLWRIADKAATPLAVLAGHQGRVRSGVFAESGQLIITASDDKTARLWNGKTGEPVGGAGGVLQHPEMVLFATFSPDGTLAITGCDDNNAYVWHAAGDGPAAVKFVLPGHTAAVTSAAISPDGRRAVTGSQDGIAKVWDLETGKEILSLKRHTAELTSVHFSPDGSSILTSSLDQTALLWPAAKIGPSLKLSAARLQIGRTAGSHIIDAQARIFEPDQSNLAGAMLKARLTAEAGQLPVSMRLVASPDNTLVEPQSTNDAAAAQFRFQASAKVADAERLLRSLALQIEQPVDSPVALHVQLVDAGGQVVSEAKAVIESADPSEPASLATARAK